LEFFCIGRAIKLFHLASDHVDRSQAVADCIYQREWPHASDRDEWWPMS